MNNFYIPHDQKLFDIQIQLAHVSDMNWYKTNQDFVLLNKLFSKSIQSLHILQIEFILYI